MFEIRITETKIVKKIVGKDWAVVGQKEVPREPRFYSRDLPGNDNEPKTLIEEVRGYTPEIEKNVEVTSEVLKQNVETLDLTKVIKAINNL